MSESTENKVPVAAEWEIIELSKGDEYGDILPESDQVDRFEDGDKFLLQRDVELFARELVMIATKQIEKVTGDETTAEDAVARIMEKIEEVDSHE